jgi:hypothetical protein
MKKILVLVITLILTTFLHPTSAQAIGIAMGPPSFEISNAMRGGEYEQTVTIFNPGDTETDYQLSAVDQSATWLSFYNSKDETPVQKFAISPKGSLAVLVKIDVPSDTPNGTYGATIFADTTPSSSQGDYSAGVGMRAQCRVTIGVTGTQITDGTVRAITAMDTEAGLALRLIVNFQNTGNVSEQPKIDAHISRGDTQLAHIVNTQTTVKPYSTQDILVEWGTQPDQPGDYTAQVSVSLGQTNLANQTLAVRVLPLGTLTRLGEFTSLDYSGQPQVGSMIKLQAVFKATGQADLLAKLMAEVYYNGNLVNTIQSENALVMVGRSAEINAYLKLDKAGTYTLKSHVSFEGKQSEVKELSITAAGGNSASSALPIPTIGIAAGALVIIAVFLVFRRNRSRS